MVRTTSRLLTITLTSLLLLLGLLVVSGGAGTAATAARCSAGSHHQHHRSHHRKHHRSHHGKHHRKHHRSHHRKHHRKHHHSHHRQHHHSHHHGCRHSHRHRHHHHGRHQHAGPAARDARVLRVAASRRGTPYRWGATGPHAFDCSGFTSWVYRQVGVHLPRTAAEQAHATRHVSHRAERPGDLVFFASHHHVYHVGIYAGHHSIWHAPHTGAVVRREHLWTRAYGVGRVR